MTSSTNFPFLTDVDPVTSGEGALDPLGLSTIADRLADEILPGLRARMSRPRFLTAIAVSSAVCDGIEEQVSTDHATPTSIVFEWLLVEGFARYGDRKRTTRTPGIQKALDAKQTGEQMCARTYLRAPTVFGFHGIYKPLARHLNIVDQDLRLADNGYALLKEWQADQGLPGFLASSVLLGSGTADRQSLRAAVDDALKQAYSTRSPSWQGWSWLPLHLSPGRMGRREAAFLHRLLLKSDSEMSGEVFRLLQDCPPSTLPEAVIVRSFLIPRATPALRRNLRAIQRFEELATLLEDAFNWVRYLSSTAGARAITATDYSRESRVRRIPSALPAAIEKAESALRDAPPTLQQRLTELSASFDHISNPGDLFEAVLTHHSTIQKNKKPDGKRDWFERGPNGATFVRTPYRVSEPISARTSWNRPYRIDSVRSFLADLTRRT